MQLRAQSLRPVAPAAGRAAAFVPVCQAGRAASRSAPRSGRALPGAGLAGQQPAPQPRGQAQVCRSAATSDKLISTTEVPAFIQRDDMIDQLFSWSRVEAGESGQRNFGLPMTVTPQYLKLGDQQVLWGFYVGIYREGNKLCDISCSFDREITRKAEYIGIGEDGFPVAEGRQTDVQGKNFEIWKVGDGAVDEDLRRTIRAYCTALAQSLNRYYAFGSVFVDDAQ